MRIHGILATLLLVLPACGKRDRTADTSTDVALTPVAVTDIDLGRSINADKSIKDNTDSFRPTDTIYASVETEGTGDATIKARWLFQDGQLVEESSQTITATDRSRTEFHLSKPDGWPIGTYRVEVTLNGAAAGTKEFSVK